MLVDAKWPPNKAPQERRSPVMMDRTIKRCLELWAWLPKTSIKPQFGRQSLQFIGCPRGAWEPDGGVQREVSKIRHLTLWASRPLCRTRGPQNARPAEHAVKRTRDLVAMRIIVTAYHCQPRIHLGRSFASELVVFFVLRLQGKFLGCLNSAMSRTFQIRHRSRPYRPIMQIPTCPNDFQLRQSTIRMRLEPVEHYRTSCMMNASGQPSPHR